MLAEPNGRPTPATPTTAERIRAARRERGWSQVHLARHLGMAATTISRWERGRSAPQGHALGALARTLDRPRAWFGTRRRVRMVPAPRLEAVSQRVALVLAEVAEAARRARRAMPALALAAVVLLGSGAVFRAAGAAERDEAIAYVAAVEQAKGHLLASREVYRRGQHVRAGVHASHPIHELGYRLWRPATAVDRALGAQVQAALKEPGQAVGAKVPSREYDALVDRTLALLDRAVARVAPDAMRADPRFQARVIQALLIAIDEEYEEAIAEGRVVLEIEYQDAWGFFQRLRARWQPLRRQLARSASATVATIDEQMAVLGRALPGIDTPATPVAVERVKTALDAIAAALRKSIG